MFRFSSSLFVRTAARLALSLGVLVSVASCSGGGWFGERSEPPVPGERVSALESAFTLKLFKG